MPTRLENRFLVFAGTVLLYGVLSLLLPGRYQHFQMVLLAVLYLLVLPAAVFGLRGSKPSGAAGLAPPTPTAGVLVLAAYLIPALALSWISSQGLLIPDESAYQFEARTFASGEWAAQAPPGAPEHSADTPVALFFEHHVLDHGKWFGKYPVGWPLLLALGLRLHAGWVVNPLLGLLILWLTFVITRRLFGSALAALAVLMGVLSPFFIANCVGRMAHPLCGVLMAGACLCCFAGLHTGRLGPFLWMYVLIGLGCHVRPVTAAGVGAPLVLGALWYLRRNRLFAPLLAAGVLAGALTAGSVVVYNKIYTGRYLMSPYVLASPHGPPDVDLHPAALLYHLTHQTRWAMRETVFYTFVFIFLLAAYAVWREREHRREARILAWLFPMIVLVHLIEPAVNIEFSGERYYFEAYFAVLILAARGTDLLLRGWGTTRRTLAAGLTLLAALSIVQQVQAAEIILARSKPFREMRAVAERYDGRHYLVFWRTTPPLVYGKHFNLNRPDWQNQDLFYLVDPGPGERDEWACRLDRPDWVVIGYDAAAAAATEEKGKAGGCIAQPPAGK